ncbi:hypothetical protein GWI33_014543, partial [Rhynchophorus ferrugineus]
MSSAVHNGPMPEKPLYLYQYYTPETSRIDPNWNRAETKGEISGEPKTEEGTRRRSERDDAWAGQPSRKPPGLETGKVQHGHLSNGRGPPNHISGRKKSGTASRRTRIPNNLLRAGRGRSPRPSDVYRSIPR